MKIFLSFFLCINASFAKTIICNTDVLRTPCGTGEVYLEFETEELTFLSRNGDVGCWGGGSTKVIGKLTKQAVSHPYFSSDDYLLVSSKDGRDFAKLIYNVEQRRARLLILDKTIHGEILSEDYHLNCQERPQEEDYDYCFKECGRSCYERPVFCGQW